MEEDNKKSMKKKTMGRQKIEMKRIEKRSSLQVTFTKRRMGLFRKASEMSILCGTEMAILVQSPANKIFAFGNESILDRFHHQTRFVTSACSTSESDNSSRKKYDDAVRKLEEEKKRMLLLMESKIMENKYCWWDAPIDNENTELHELEEFVEALEELRTNVDDKINNDNHKQKVIDVEDFSSSNLLLPNLESNHDEDGADEFNYTDLLQLEDYFGGEQYGGNEFNVVQAPTHHDPASSSSSQVLCNNNNSSSSDYNMNHLEDDDISLFEELEQYMKTNPVPEFGFLLGDSSFIN